jgi:site-specific DNA recombinase
MIASYKDEQLQINSRITVLDSAITDAKEKTANVRYIISLAHQYSCPIELTGKVIREFISRIIVYKPEVANGIRKQRVRIVYNGMGEILLPGQSQILSTR